MKSKIISLLLLTITLGAFSLFGDDNAPQASQGCPLSRCALNQQSKDTKMMEPTAPTMTTQEANKAAMADKASATTSAANDMNEDIDLDEDEDEDKTY